MEMIRNGRKYFLPVTDVSLQRSLMGVFLLKFKTPTPVLSEDVFKVTYDDEKYSFAFAKIEGDEVTAHHVSYDLGNYALMDKFFNTPPTYSETVDFADAKLEDLVESFLKPLYSDAGYDLVNTVTVNNTVKKDISFSANNLLSALQVVAETYDVEFSLSDNKVLLCDTVGEITGLQIRSGVETKGIKKSIDKTNICSVVYPSGASDNLPEKYYYAKLKPTHYAEFNTSKPEDELFGMWNENHTEWTGTRIEWKTAIVDWDNTQATWKGVFQPLWSGNFTELQKAIADWHEILVLKDGKHFNILDLDEDGSPVLELSVCGDVDLIGRIEKVVDFPEVKVRSRRGMIHSTGRDTVEGKEFPYFVDGALADIDTTLLKDYNKVGLMLTDGMLHRAEDLRIMNFDESNCRLYYSENLKEPEGAKISFVPPVGSTYVLVGYVTPEEVNAASQELYDKTLGYLDDNDTPVESYTISDTVFRGRDVYLNAGDTVRLLDKAQGIDIGIRIQSFEYNPVNKVYSTIKFSTSTDKIPNDFLRDFINTRNKILQLQGVIRGFYAQMGSISDDLIALNEEVLTQLAENMQVLEDALEELNDVTLIDLQERLNSLSETLANINTVTLPALSSSIAENESKIGTLNTVTLPALNSVVEANAALITTNESKIGTLNTVTLPALNTALDEKLSDLPSVIKGTHISDSSISTPKIKTNAVTANEIAADTITANEIAAGTITTNNLNVDEIVGNTAWFNKITANHIAAGAITANEIAADTITTNNLNVNEIVGNTAWFNKIIANHIAAGTITTNEIAADTITTNNLNVDEIVGNTAWFNKITANHIASGSITTDEIKANTITTGDLNVNEIVGNQAWFDSITSNHIKAGQITSSHVAVGGINSDRLSSILQASIANAETDSTSALALLGDISSDTKLTPTEKLEVKRTWEGVQEEYTKYAEQAIVFEINGAGSEFESYQTAYNALNSYITPLLSNMNVTDTIARSVFDQKFSDYYASRGGFLQRLTNEVRAGSAVSIGVDGNDNGYVKVNESIVGDSAQERFWLLGKDGMSYNVVDSEGTSFSLNGGKVIGYNVVNFKAPAVIDVAMNPGAGTDVYIQERDGKRLGIDPNKVRCMTTYAGVTILPDNKPTSTVTHSVPIYENGLITGFNVFAAQESGAEPFQFSHTKDSMGQGSWVNFGEIYNSTLAIGFKVSLIGESYKQYDWTPFKIHKGTYTVLKTASDNLIRKVIFQTYRHGGYYYDVRAQLIDSAGALIRNVTLFSNFVGHDNGYWKLSTNNQVESYFIANATYVDADINVLTIYS